MNFDDICEGTIYEVLEEDTKVYTSTSVSGGGGYVGNSGGRINTVSSTVHHHSDQHIWLKNLDTGKEEKYEFGSFNIPARVGHKLYCVFNKKTGKFERVVNLNTGEKSSGNGIFTSGARLSVFEYIKTFALVLLMFWIPPLQFFVIYLAKELKGSFAKVQEILPTVPYAKTKMVSMVMTGVVLFLLTWWAGVIFTRPLKFGPYWVGSFLISFPMGFLYMSGYKSFISHIAKMGAIVDEHVKQFVKNYKPETSEVTGSTEKKLA